MPALVKDAITLCLLMWLPALAVSAELTVLAVAPDGKPLLNTVVALRGADLAPEVRANKAEMNQIRTQFEPHVLVIGRDSLVEFPNLDRTRHQVYSFSSVKRFVTNLYAGREADPVQFEKTGLVPVGCHIHDRMKAFIYVTDAPRYGITDGAGQVLFKDIAAGEYQLEALHPWQQAAGTVERDVRVLSSTQPITVRMQLGAIGSDPRQQKRAATNPLIRSNPFAR